MSMSTSSPQIDYSISRDDSGASITVIQKTTGESRTLPSTHLRYQALRELLLTADSVTWSQVTQVADVAPHLRMSLSAISPRASFDGTNFMWDGDVIDNAMSRHLVRMLRANDERYVSVIRFMERLAKNPSQLSRISLWAWLDANDFTITPDGMVVAYKGVQNTPDNLSMSSGVEDVSVNGVIHRGHIPNPVGAVVTMPRSLIDADRNSACSRGLHVGTHAYADRFGVNLLLVLADPADFVSVPHDCNAAKARVCRYQVLSMDASRIDQPVYDDDGDDEDDEFERDDESGG